MEVSRPGLVSRPDVMGLGLVLVSYLKGLVSVLHSEKWCFSCRQIFDKKNIWSRSLILKVSVSEGVVSVSNGQVLVSDDEVSVSDDEVPVSDSEAETPSLILSQNNSADKLFTCEKSTYMLCMFKLRGVNK